MLHQLLATADVFVTNNPKMESLERARLDPTTVKQLNPRLTYVALSGYGHSGPKANRGGYDLIAQGEAGLMALTGEPGEGPEAVPPPRSPTSPPGSTRRWASWLRSTPATTPSTAAAAGSSSTCRWSIRS